MTTLRYEPARCPATDEVASDTLALAQHQLLADERAMRDVAEAVDKVLAHLGEL